MILDEFGRPLYRPVGFITPKWIVESMAKLLRADVDAYSTLATEQRVDDLYASAEVERPTTQIIGNVVSVAVPERFRPMK